MAKQLIPLTGVSSDFVNLGRTLSDIALGNNLSDDTDLQRMLGRGQGRPWNQLINEMRVVVLAVAGAGKTREIRDLAHRLRADGKRAFFIRLELVANQFELAFEPGMYATFQDWLASSEEGWLLFDSVDESRLRHTADFELAILSVSNILATKGANSRAHIFLTSRIGAWRPVTDLVLCRDLLPHPTLRSGRQTKDSAQDGFEAVEGSYSEAEEIAPGFAVVGLDELTDDQIGRFAAAKGVSDTSAFLKEIERKDATAFARRPQDLEDLVQFWRENGRVGTRWEMMAANVDRRMTERDQTRAESSQLSPERARDGARMLAAATTLSGIQVIRVPDGASALDAGIDPSVLLPGWCSVEIGILLQRPVFDSPIYGTVRFHHRSVREFLAAEWFADILGKAPSRLGVEQLFFRKKFGIEIVTPLLRPVLPWLLAQDKGIRSHVMRLAPEVVFEGGDPSRLPLDDRRRILTEVCELLVDGASGRSALDYAAVQRFADDELAEDVRSLLRQYAGHEEVAPFLLRMVWLGRLRAALPEALELATNSADFGYRKLTALKALGSIADEETLAAVREAFLLAPGELSRREVAEILSGLGGSANDVAWFLSAVERAGPKQKYNVDILASESKRFISRVTVDALPQLIDGMAALLRRSPVVERPYYNVSVIFEWLLVPAAHAVERLILERSPAVFSQNSLSIIRKVGVGRIYGSEDVAGERQNLTELFKGWKELNWAQFWYDIEQMRSELTAGERLLDWWFPSNCGAVWNFTGDDFDSALGAISSRSFIDDKMVALSLAFELYRTNGRPRNWLNLLKKATLVPELTERLDFFLHPQPNPEMQRYRANERRRVKRQEKRRERENDDLSRSVEYLSADLDSIRKHLAVHPESAADHRAIRYLFNRMRDRRGIANRWSDYDWSSLREPFGDPVAEMFRDAARGYWRHNLPQLISEGTPDNEIPFSTILGLIGLEIETSESKAVLATLTVEEVEIACRYAVLEMNGFPSWFATLFEHHPQVVTDFLFAQIQYEAFLLPEDRAGDYILSDVAWSGQWAWNLLGPRLLRLLVSGEPQSAKALGSILKILKGSSITDEQLASMARAHALDSTSKNLGHWFAFWIGVEPTVAIAALEERLNSQNKREAADLAMRTAVRLFGNRFDEPGIARELFLQPSSLASLHRIFHLHIPRSEDISRGNSGAYSPNLRDHAQEARDSILEKLRDRRGKEAFQALKIIVDAQPERSWLRRLLNEKASLEGDIVPFAMDDVHFLATSFERRPRTPDQLAETALLRLLQIKRSAEVARSLSVESMNLGNTESVAAYLASEMLGSKSYFYGVVQKNDAIFLNAIESPGTIQHRVCCAVVPYGNRIDTKTWLQPEEGQFDSNRRTFVLVRTARNQGWRWPWAKKPDLTKAKDLVEDHWRSVESSEVLIDDVDVITIDLTSANSAVIPRDILDRVLDFIRWRFGSSVLRLGASIAIFGATALTGWWQIVVEAVAAQIFDVELHIPETSNWIGWGLICFGVTVAIVGHFLQKK